MRNVPPRAPLDLIAAIVVTLMCTAVIITFIVSADPVWLIADTAAIFALGIWLMWRRTLH
jgi:predicted ABC-type exoprotein transport system permease subunit